MSRAERQSGGEDDHHHQGAPPPPIYSLEVGLLLGEHADAEVSVLVGLEGGGHDEVLARRQREAAAHLTQVDEGLGARGRRVALEEVAVQVDAPLAAVLMDRWGEGREGVNSEGTDSCSATN